MVIRGDKTEKKARKKIHAVTFLPAQISHEVTEDRTWAYKAKRQSLSSCPLVGLNKKTKRKYSQK
jgi:hypothetical protein